ncbi:MAG: glutamate racemase [Sutterella sp.]|nr:glutamate racemase [Sutterella sp.]
MSNLPIGILDSGFGGLSVMKAIRDILPKETLIYAADCECAPWGDRDNDYINERIDVLVSFLQAHHIKALVLACNTATAVGAQRLRDTLSIPVIGIEPAVLPAMRATQTGVVGVMATVKTIESEKYAHLKTHVNANIRVIDCPCPGLMECVEAGDFHSPHTYDLIKHFVNPLLKEGVDQIVLGCTHYPFLREAIQAVAGPHVTLIDPSPAVARHLSHTLEEAQLLADNDTGREYFYITGANAERAKVLHHLWSSDAQLLALP